MEWKMSNINRAGAKYKDGRLFRIFQFTDEEKADLRRILSGRRSDLVESFIFGLSGICESYDIFLRQESAAQSWQKVEDLLPVLKEALRAVKLLEKEVGIPLRTMKSVPKLSKVYRDIGVHFIDKDLTIKARFDCPTLARDAELALTPLIKTLEEIKPQRPGRGRPSSEGGFASAVSDYFSGKFEEKLLKQVDGPLCQILKICLEGMGLPFEDPERRLKSVRQK